VKNNIFNNPKLLLLVETIALLICLLVSISLRVDQVFKSNEELILRESELFTIEIENFIQSGQIFINSYSSNLILDENNDSLVLQLKRSLLPFPFFSQLNILDSSGIIIAGFPQNNYGQSFNGTQESSILKSGIGKDVYVLPKRTGNSSSLFLFVKEIKKDSQNTSYFLVGESDLRANLLNTGLSRMIQLLNKERIRISITDNNGNELLKLTDPTFENQPLENIYRVDQKITTQDWSISFSFVKADLFWEALISLIPMILFILAFEGVLVISYLHGNKKKNNGATFKNADIFDSNSLEKRRNDFQLNLLKVTNLEEIAKLFLNFAELNNVSSIRILLFENPFSSSRNKFIVFGTGKKSDEYSYLDLQLAKLTEESQSIEISDLRESQQIHLRQDKDYPLAIHAFPIRLAKTTYGLLWYGYEKSYQVTDIEKNYIEQIIETGKNLLITILKNSIYKDISIQLNQVLENIPAPILLLDKENKVLYSNHEASEIILPHGEIFGKKIQELIGDSFQPNENINGNMRSSKAYKSANGSTFLLHEKSFNTSDDQANKIIFFEDITSQDVWKRDLTEKTALLSHDLRIPLTTIQGYLSMLPIMGQINQQQRDYIEKGLSQIEEMSDQIKGLLTIERLEMGDGLSKQKTGINSLLDEIIKSLQPLADQKRIELLCAYRENHEENISLDLILIKMAVSNLIENAIRYSANQGSVKIRTGQVQKMMEIAIEDNGSGIAAVDIPHIFEKFYRVKINSNTRQTGSGFSLALVKSIVEKHGGEVGAVSNLGKGTTFFIRLPIN
jgi:signal transduction histidine kinase